MVYLYSRLDFEDLERRLEVGSSSSAGLDVSKRHLIWIV